MPRNQRSMQRANVLASGLKRFPKLSYAINSIDQNKLRLGRLDFHYQVLSAVAEVVATQREMSLNAVAKSIRAKGVFPNINANQIAQVITNDSRHAMARSLPSSAITLSKQGDNPTMVRVADSYLMDVVNQCRLQDIDQTKIPFLPYDLMSMNGSIHGMFDLPGGTEALAAIDGEVFELDTQYRPSGANIQTVLRLVYHVEGIAAAANPDCHISARLFGSRSCGLSADTNDVDITLVATTVIGNGQNMVPVNNPEEILARLTRGLRRAGGFYRVVNISKTQVPIVKFKYSVKQNGQQPIVLEGDISVNGQLGLAKSAMLESYLAVDPRVRPLLVTLKQWSSKRLIADSNTLNTFGLIMMAIAFLISCRVVPPLQLLNIDKMDPVAWDRLDQICRDPDQVATMYSNKRRKLHCLQTNTPLPVWIIEGNQQAYFLDSSRLRHWKTPNTESVSTLLYKMFQYYGSVFQPHLHAISPRLGSTTIPRNSLTKLCLPNINSSCAMALKNGSVNAFHGGVRTLVIEDPFVLSVNCGRNAPPEWVEGMLWEMRRAAWIMSQHHVFGGRTLERILAPPSAEIFGRAECWFTVYARLWDLIFTNTKSKSKQIKLLKAQAALVRLGDKVKWADLQQI